MNCHAATATAASTAFILLPAAAAVEAFLPHSGAARFAAPLFAAEDASAGPSPQPPPPLPDTADPFVLLGLHSSVASSDYPSGAVHVRDVHRAYRRMALQYHPDAVTTRDSTAEEKRRANDDFARINAAYEALRKGRIGTGGIQRAKAGGGAGNGVRAGGAGGGADWWSTPHSWSKRYASTTTFSSTRMTSGERTIVRQSSFWKPKYHNFQRFDRGYTVGQYSRCDAGGQSLDDIYWYWYENGMI